MYYCIVSQWGELLVQPVCTYCQSVGTLSVSGENWRTTGTACVYLLSVSVENYWYNLCVLIVSQWRRTTGTTCVYLLSVSGENYWYSLCVLIVSQCLLVHPGRSQWVELLVQPVCTSCVYLLSVSGENYWYNLCVLIVSQ